MSLPRLRLAPLTKAASASAPPGWSATLSPVPYVSPIGATLLYVADGYVDPGYIGAN